MKVSLTFLFFFILSIQSLASLNSPVIYETIPQELLSEVEIKLKTYNNFDSSRPNEMPSELEAKWVDSSIDVLKQNFDSAFLFDTGGPQGRINNLNSSSLPVGYSDKDQKGLFVIAIKNDRIYFYDYRLSLMREISGFTGVEVLSAMEQLVSSFRSQDTKERSEIVKGSLVAATAISAVSLLDLSDPVLVSGSLSISSFFLIVSFAVGVELLNEKFFPSHYNPESSNLKTLRKKLISSPGKFKYIKNASSSFYTAKIVKALKEPMLCRNI